MSEDRTRQLPDDGVRLILARLDSMDARFDSMEARLTTLEDKVDRRLQETRPIWEQVLVRMTAVEERLTSVKQEVVGVKEGLARVETQFGKVEDEIYDLNKKFSIFNKDILKLQDKHEDLKERVDRLGPEHAR